jgi:hypothetical protein
VDDQNLLRGPPVDQVARSLLSGALRQRFGRQCPNRINCRTAAADALVPNVGHDQVPRARWNPAAFFAPMQFPSIAFRLAL